MAIPKPDFTSLDNDLERKKESKHDHNREQEALDWISQVTGDELPSDFHTALCNGIALCKTINVILNAQKPIKISTSNLPFKQMENIHAFLERIKVLGVPSFECFQTIDLYEKKNLNQIGWQGPRLGPKLAQKVVRNFTQEQLIQARMAIPRLQSFKGGASQAGMGGFGGRREISSHSDKLEEEKRKAEARKKAEEEARKLAEEEARLKAEEEARLKAEEEARLKAEEEARLKAEEEARLKAEEEARLKAEEEARLKAEEEARLKAEEEARLKAEEEARLKAEEEARLKAEEDARKAAEEAKRIAQEEASRKAEEEAKRIAEEEARKKAQEEAKKRSEEEAARQRAEEQARKLAEEQAKRLAEEAKRIAEEEERIRAEQEAIRTAEAKRIEKEEEDRKIQRMIAEEQEAQRIAEEQVKKILEEQQEKRAAQENALRIAKEQEASKRAKETANREQSFRDVNSLESRIFSQDEQAKIVGERLSRLQNLQYEPIDENYEFQSSYIQDNLGILGGKNQNSLFDSDFNFNITNASYEYESCSEEEEEVVVIDENEEIDDDQVCSPSVEAELHKLESLMANIRRSMSRHEQ